MKITTRFECPVCFKPELLNFTKPNRLTAAVVSVHCSKCKSAFLVRCTLSKTQPGHIDFEVLDATLSGKNPGLIYVDESPPMENITLQKIADHLKEKTITTIQTPNNGHNEKGK